MAPQSEVWHAWRRPESGGAWEQAAGIKGTKYDAVRMLETLERQASYESYEYRIMPGDEIPPTEFRMRRRFG